SRSHGSNEGPMGSHGRRPKPYYRHQFTHRGRPMLRQLTFDYLDETKRYILCYQALVFGKAPLARNELRAHGSLLTKLERIGVIANPVRDDGAVMLYKTIKGGQVI